MPKPYRWLAEHYDSFFADGRDRFVEARRHILGRILPSVSSACDLACGTGTTAIELARRGIPAYAVDLSPAMCRLAREKASRARLPVTVIRGDMRDFRLPKPVGLITCEYDAVNHVPAKSDLKLVAAAAYRALSPGGYWLFDVNTQAAFRRFWAGTVWLEKDGVVAVMRNGNNAAEHRAWSDIDWFLRDGRSWQRYSERVEEVCWTPAEIRTALHGAGFSAVRAWDAKPFFASNPAMRPGFRTFYLARRG